MNLNLELVRLSELPMQTSTAFETVGIDEADGKATRVAPNLMAQYLTENGYINRGQSIVIEGKDGILTFAKIKDGTIYIAHGNVSQMVLPGISDFVSIRILFTAGSEQIAITSAQRQEIFYLLPQKIDSMEYRGGEKYLMDISALGEKIYCTVHRVSYTDHAK